MDTQVRPYCPSVYVSKAPWSTTANAASSHRHDRKISGRISGKDFRTPTNKDFRTPTNRFMDFRTPTIGFKDLFLARYTIGKLVIGSWVSSTNCNWNLDVHSTSY